MRLCIDNLDLLGKEKVFVAYCFIEENDEPSIAGIGKAIIFVSGTSGTLPVAFASILQNAFLRLNKPEPPLDPPPSSAVAGDCDNVERDPRGFISSTPKYVNWF